MTLCALCVAMAAGAGRPVIAALAVVLPEAEHASGAAVASENVVVMDAQTLRLSGRVVRLAGVAAPPRGQECAGAADCAGAAALHLADLVRDRRVACQVERPDASGPAEGRCEVGGTNIAQALIAGGWAEARGDRPVLKRAEDQARARHLGLWAGQ